MFAFLVIPAALGLLVARGLKGTFSVAMGAALVAIFLGIWFSYRFDRPGTFSYACVIHPTMRGTVSVA